jgi:hypothetical protein
VSESRPVGITLLSLLLGFLGAATLITYAIAVLRFPSESVDELFLTLLGVGSAAAAILSAWLLWRVSAHAPKAFLAWCLSTIVFDIVLASGISEMRDPLMLPSYVLAVVLFAWGYRYTRRACRPATIYDDGTVKPSSS